MELAEAPEQGHGERRGQRQQQQLAVHAARVALLDQLAPAGGEAEASAGQRRAEADAHQEQYGLARRHAPQQQNEKGGQCGRQRKALHRIS